MLDVVRSAFSNIKKFFNKDYQYYLSIYLILNVMWLFFCIISCRYFRLSYQNFSVSLFFLMILNIAYICLLAFIKKIKFDRMDIFLFLLVIFGIVATIFAKDVSISLYGYWKRYEGFFQLLYYYSLMYLSTNIFKDKYKKSIIYFILGFGVISVLVCFIQIYDILKFINVGFRGKRFGMGLMFNTNFAGSYMTLCLGLSIGIFLYSTNKKWFEYVIKLLLCLLFFSGLLMSNALSGVVGLFIVCLLILIYFIYNCIKRENIKNNIIKHFVLFVSCFLVFVMLSSSNNNGTVIGDDILNFSSETVEIARGNSSNRFGNGRMFIWGNTLKVVPKYLLHGAGIDNFYNAFDEPLFSYASFNKNLIIYYDKAHNEYLQKLVCEGLFSCMTYISMLFIIFVKAIKENIKMPNYISIALFFGFVGYAVQAFFNISVIEVAPFFWLVMGLLYDRKCKV